MHSVVRLSSRTISAWLPFDPTYLPAAVSTPARKPAAIAAIFPAIFPTLPAAGPFPAFVSDTVLFALDYLLAAGSAWLSLPAGYL